MVVCCQSRGRAESVAAFLCINEKKPGRPRFDLAQLPAAQLEKNLARRTKIVTRTLVNRNEVRYMGEICLLLQHSDESATTMPCFLPQTLKPSLLYEQQNFYIARTVTA